MSKKDKVTGIRPDDEEEFEDIDDEEEEEGEEEEEEDTTIANSCVTEKYKSAAAFANKALQTVLGLVQPGAKVHDLCNIGDSIILEETKKVYNKNTSEGTKMDKGIAFPTCVSVNSVVCHFSPCEEDAESVPPLAAGDVVRVDLGCHIDGYCAIVGDTVVVGANADHPVSSPAANVITAAHTAIDVITKALRPGTKVYEITALLASVANDFGVNVVEGVLSHNMRRYIIDGNNVIANKDCPEAKVHDIEIQENQVWALNVVFSTGSGKLRPKETRTQVYKRSLEGNYQLKLQASREVLNEINAKFQTFPFSIRQLKQKRARIGIQECLRHDVVIPFPVLYEKEGEAVAMVKSTVLILSSKIDPITVIPFNKNVYVTDKTLQDAKALAWTQRNFLIKKKKAEKAEGQTA